MRFEYPWLLLALLALPGLFVWRRRRPDTAPAAVGWGHLPAAEGVRARIFAALAALPWIVLAVSLIAAARPQRGLDQSEIDSRAWTSAGARHLAQHARRGHGRRHAPVGGQGHGT